MKSVAFLLLKRIPLIKRRAMLWPADKMKWLHNKNKVTCAATNALSSKFKFAFQVKAIIIP